nr:hypothetical protein [Yersinia enterocolitica]
MATQWVTNPTPFYMNYQSVIVGGKEVPDVTYVAPMSTAHFPVTGVGGGSVVWKIITDFGAVGQLHTSTF